MKPRSIAILALASVLAACSPTGPGSVTLEPSNIREVWVHLSDSVPATVEAEVWGEIGGGCSELLPYEVERLGAEVRLSLTVRTTIPAGTACTEQLKGYRERYPLPGTYPPGDYTLHVNDVVRTFTVPLP